MGVLSTAPFEMKDEEVAARSRVLQRQVKPAARLLRWHRSSGERAWLLKETHIQRDLMEDCACFAEVRYVNDFVGKGKPAD